VEVIGKLSDIDRCFCVSYRNEVMDVGMLREEIVRWEGGGGGILGWNLYCSWEVLEMLKLYFRTELCGLRSWGNGGKRGQRVQLLTVGEIMVVYCGTLQDLTLP
jgi:hypothetical protein